MTSDVYRRVLGFLVSSVQQYCRSTGEHNENLSRLTGSKIVAVLNSLKLRKVKLKLALSLVIFHNVTLPTMCAVLIHTISSVAQFRIKQTNYKAHVLYSGFIHAKPLYGFLL